MKNKKELIPEIIILFLLLLTTFITIAITARSQYVEKYNKCTQTYSDDYCKATVK